jgi:hypothetical protein
MHVTKCLIGVILYNVCVLFKITLDVHSLKESITVNGCDTKMDGL